MTDICTHPDCFDFEPISKSRCNHLTDVAICEEKKTRDKIRKEQESTQNDRFEYLIKFIREHPTWSTDQLQKFFYDHSWRISRNIETI